MSFIKEYWPFAVIFGFFAYKFWKTGQVKKKLPALRAQGAFFLDVRSPMEFNSGHAPNCVNIPLNELGSRLNEIPKNKPVVVCCASGTRSGMAKAVLSRHGIKEVHNIGPWNNLNS